MSGSVPDGYTVSVPVTVFPVAVSEATLDRVTQRLNAFARQSALELALNVGRVIFEELYGGDEAAWHARGVKDTSFRKLQARARQGAGSEALLLSPSVLSRSTAIYVMVQRLGVSNWQHLGVSHLRVIATLPVSAQAGVVDAALAGRWDVARVEAQCRVVRKRTVREGETARTGRPPQPAYLKRLKRLEKAMAQCVAVTVTKEVFADMPPERAAKLVVESRAVMTQVAHHQQALAEMLECLRTCLQHQEETGTAVQEPTQSTHHDA